MEKRERRGENKNVEGFFSSSSIFPLRLSKMQRGRADIERKPEGVCAKEGCSEERKGFVKSYLNALRVF